MKLRVGIVGCGKFADVHVQQVQVLDSAEVVAVCDLEPLMARQMAVRYSLPAMYSDLGRMLAEQRLDVLHITTPPASHPALASIAMEAGCHVFVEKPLALNLKAAQAIVAAAEHHTRKLCINYWYNYDPPGEALRRLVEEGVLGEPVHVESVFGYDLSGVFGSALLGDNEHWVHHLPGKLFHNVLDHVVNKIALFMPDADPRISAFDHRHRPASGDAVTDAVMDELRFLMQGERVSGYGLISSHARPAGQTLRVYGTRNTIQVDFQKRTVVVETAQTVPAALGRLLAAFSHARGYRRCAYGNLRQFLWAEFHAFEGMRRLLRAFYDCIRHDTAPPIPYAEMLRVSGLMDALIGRLAQTRLALEGRR